MVSQGGISKETVHTWPVQTRSARHVRHCGWLRTSAQIAVFRVVTLQERHSWVHIPHDGDTAWSCVFQTEPVFGIDNWFRHLLKRPMPYAKSELSDRRTVAERLAGSYHRVEPDKRPSCLFLSPPPRNVPDPSGNMDGGTGTQLLSCAWRRSK